VAVFDYDGDGGLDLLLRNYRQPTQLLRNVGPRGRWIALKLTGTRSNRDAVGSRIRVRTANGGWQTRIVTDDSGYLSNSSLVQHFGLPSDAEVIEGEITWPSGEKLQFGSLLGDRKYLVTEGGGVQVVPVRAPGAGGDR
jgi:hypothetical protein